MKRKLFFLFIAALVLVPWTVAYAYDDAAAATGPVEIVPAPSGSLPQFNAFGNAIGGVTAGDLFLVDTTHSPDDIALTLYITNTDDLIHTFRYVTLNIGVYVLDAAGRWAKISAGEDTGDTYLTMQNGAVCILLAGGARYKITIDKGCFSCYPVNPGRAFALPDFLLTIN